MNIISLDQLVDKLGVKKQEQGLKFAKRINLTYIPSKEKPLVKLNGTVICSVGNASLIIAPPGTGKSRVCEAAAAGGANPECDSLGFEVDSAKTLMVDTERVQNDVYRGYKEMKARCGLSFEEMDKRVHMFSFMEAETTEQMKSELEHLVSTGNYELVIIDGSADFVKSVNDEEESKNFWRWLIILANKFGFGMIITIHPNPGEDEGKATGHLGSQGQKKAESVFNVFKSQDDKDIRMLTTESGHGKVRNGGDKLTASFTWSKEEGMFVSCTDPTKKKIKGAKDLFSEDKLKYTYKELCTELVRITGKSLATAKRMIKDATELEDIYKNGGFYYLNSNGNAEVQDEIEQEIDEDVVPF